MIYGSVCSGIEAATVAWRPLGWKAAFFAEIDKFPSAVLAHHYPTVPNFGDFTTIKPDQHNAIDLLVGGTPCQSFSIAGLRGGLADGRGNLALEYLRLADRARPRWLVWENVPGVLSSEGGRDFGSILGGMVELGYGVAYRVLDAQYCRVGGFWRAVPQRRRRVFIVGYLGDWRRAAAVLFERASLLGDSAPVRKAGKGIAQAVAGSLGAGDGNRGWRNDLDQGAFIPAVSPALKARDYKGPSSDGDGDGSPLVAHALRADGFDASEDGTGRGTPLVPVMAFSSKDSGNDCQINVAPTMRAMNSVEGNQNAGGQIAITYPINTQIAMRHEALGESTGMGIGSPDDPGFTLQAGHSHAVAFQSNESFSSGDCINVSPTLRIGSAGGGNPPAVAFDMRGWDGGAQFEGPHDTANIRAASGGSSRSYVASWAVRRLTPRECERLQGFPDDYTLIPWRKGVAPDGPRYKALGNSMAVNVMRWIGTRIEMVESMELSKKQLA